MWLAQNRQRRDLLKRLMINLWLFTDLMFVGFATPAISAETSLNMTPGVTEISEKVYDLHMLTFFICVAIAIVVFGAMFIAIGFVA